jgi:hypothetical protein
MRVLTAGWLLVGLAMSLVFVGSCASYEGDLRLAQRAFESSEHERALAILRVLEDDVPRLSTSDRAQYAYLRGMIDYRIGYRADARHWLAIAAWLAQKTPGALRPDWEKRTSDSLQELNEEVYAKGVAALSAPPGAPTEGHTTDVTETSEVDGSVPAGNP